MCVCVRERAYVRVVRESASHVCVCCEMVVDTDPVCVCLCVCVCVRERERSRERDGACNEIMGVSGGARPGLAHAPAHAHADTE